MKNLLIMGPPGAGKGTQATVIRKEFNIPHISTGDMFREAITNGTELGKLAKVSMDAGKLVPDDVTIGIVEERFKSDDVKSGFLLDGFPRTIDQARALDELLGRLNLEIDHVINVTAPNEILVERLVGRRVCKSCGESYHIEFKQPEVEGVCNECGGELIQRSDDTEEKAQVRLDEYAKKTRELINYYQEKEKLVSIDGIGSVDEITARLKEAISK